MFISYEHLYRKQGEYVAEHIMKDNTYPFDSSFVLTRDNVTLADFKSNEDPGTNQFISEHYLGEIRKQEACELK